VPPLVPPAGWYPDPHNAAGQRYWDGAQWTEHAVVPGAETVPGVAAAPTGAMGQNASTALRASAAPAGGAIAVSAKRGLRKLKWWQWALIGLGVLVLISIIVNGINGEQASSDAAPTRPAAGTGGFSQEPKKPTEKPIEMVEVPNLVGSTVAQARTALEAVGLVLVPGEAGDDWIVTAQQPAQGSHPLEGLELNVTTEAPRPVYTLAQQNAISKAQSYLDFSGFSRAGLIDQLEYEGYSVDDSTFGADNAGADWSAEAAEKAASYLEFSSFSREGLYDQLAYEGFTDAEIQFGLAAVGY
jgi:hypothetical protein